MKNGIKIAVFGLLQLAIAGQASAQLVIAPSNLALNLAPLPVVANKDIAKLDLVAIQSIEVQNVTELGLEQLASVKADSEASESDQVAVSVTVATVSLTVPPAVTNSSVNAVPNNNNSNSDIVVITNNNNHGGGYQNSHNLPRNFDDVLNADGQLADSQFSQLINANHAQNSVQLNMFETVFDY
ncbi:MAG: hypothetical protein LW823_01470 [Rickettsiales bacterium]|jgi:hypothetical protein|nr:hypothetical protein [Rickettsiales bacterium]